MLEADRRIAGSLDTAQGTVSFERTRGSEALPEAEATAPDMPDDLAEATLRTGGQVVVLEAASMPSQTGAAAILRYY